MALRLPSRAVTVLIYIYIDALRVKNVKSIVINRLEMLTQILFYVLYIWYDILRIKEKQLYTTQLNITQFQIFSLIVIFLSLCSVSSNDQTFKIPNNFVHRLI